MEIEIEIEMEIEIETKMGIAGYRSSWVHFTRERGFWQSAFDRLRLTLAFLPPSAAHGRVADDSLKSKIP